IPSGGSVTYTVTASVSSSKTGNLVNTATVSSARSEERRVRERVSNTVTAASVDNLAITKTDGSLTYTPGAGLTYTSVASNGGPSDVTDATVADTFSAALGTPSWTAVVRPGTAGFHSS